MAEAENEEAIKGAPAANNEPASDDDDDEDLFKTDDEPELNQAGTEAPVATGPERAAPSSAPLKSGDAAASPIDAGREAPATATGAAPALAAPIAAASPLPPKKGADPLTVGENPAKFGLPEGVYIPPSVKGTLLQGRLLETLRGLPKQLINDALTEYDDAVEIKGDAIRNHGAYLYGVIKRYVSVQERAASGEGAGILPMGPELTPTVNARLQRLVEDGFCSQDEMNEKVKSKIRMLSEKDALFAIEELQSVERRQIRNFGSYFMGILNRYMRGDSQKKHDQKRQPQQEVRTPNRFDEQRRDDRYQRGNETDYCRGRDNDRNDSYRRDRSRDRFDPQRRSDGRDYRDQYDPRQGNLGYPQQPPTGGIPGNPPPPPPRPAGVPGLNSYQQQPYMQNAPAPPPMYGHPPMNQSQQFVQPLGGAPPPSSYGQQPNPQHFSQRPPVMGGHQPPQQYTQQVVQSPYGNLQSIGQPPPMQSYPPQHPHMQNRFSPAAPVQNRWNGPPTQHPSGPPPVDILGLADKAASAVQALQSQTKIHVPPPAHMYQQAGSAPYPGQPVPYGQPPGGIPQGYPAPGPSQNMGQGPPRQGDGGGRRRTTATMVEIPMTVQYAVQNLQATGQIDGPLDEGMLGMVKDLPEDLALQALQKFSTIDKNTMRNKTAYLAGVLRRELEKINRR